MAQLQATRAHIAIDNPHAARRIFLSLLKAAESLNLLPSRGRPISRGRRELTHLQPYLIRYRVEDDRVTILEVRHGARAPE